MSRVSFVFFCVSCTLPYRALLRSRRPPVVPRATPPPTAVTRTRHVDTRHVHVQTIRDTRAPTDIPQHKLPSAAVTSLPGIESTTYSAACKKKKKKITIRFYCNGRRADARRENPAAIALDRRGHGRTRSRGKRATVTRGRRKNHRRRPTRFPVFQSCGNSTGRLSAARYLQLSILLSERIATELGWAINIDV